MSDLKRLIEKFCPDGVEYREIGEVAKVTIGEFIHKNKQNPKDIYPVFNGGVDCTGYYSKFNTESNKVIISARGANAGFVNMITSKFWAGNSCYVLHEDKNLSNWKFLYYCLKNFEYSLSENKQEGSIPAISKKQVENFKIPIPPLEVQEEIVRILDKFTDLVGKLKGELNREFIARKKQYEYYRDKLLTFKSNVPRVKLKNVCNDFIVPMRDKPKTFNGDVPWCRIEDVEGKFLHGSKSEKFVSKSTIDEMNLKIFPTGTVICSCSASIGTYVINTKPLITNQTFIGIVVGEKILNTWLRYYLETQTKKLILLSNSSTIPYISKDKFKELEIPLPPLEEQDRIVNILDKFDKLCNDICEGIPAEIEARQKQYEYYRDRLLTF